MRLRHLVWAAAVLAQSLLSEGKGKDYYGALGLKKNAKESAIKKAYRCVLMESTFRFAQVKYVHLRYFDVPNTVGAVERCVWLQRVSSSRKVSPGV